VAKEGRTVIFVSHNMGAVEHLCSNGILINEGKVLKNGLIPEVIKAYLQGNQHWGTKNLLQIKNRKGMGEVLFYSYQYFNINGVEIHAGISGQPISVRLYYRVYKPQFNCRVSIAFVNKNKPLFLLSTENTLSDIINIENDGYVQFQIDRLPLDIGEYTCTLFFQSDRGIQDSMESAFLFPVENGNFFKTGKNSPQGWTGSVVLVDHSCMIK